MPPSFESNPIVYGVVASTVSRQLFLQDPYYYYDHNITPPVASISNISSSIQLYASSGTKAWSDGYTAPNTFSTVVLDAVKHEEKLVLMASVAFTVTVGVLVVLVFGLAIVQLGMKQGKPLGIASLDEALGGIPMGDMTLVTLPFTMSKQN